MMIERSYDAGKLNAFARMSDRNRSFNASTWLANPLNYMVVSGENVGLATFEYSGVYSVHWFFTARGKEAKKLAIDMIDFLFETTGAKLFRGLTPTEYKAARYMARQVGMKSYGFVETEDGEYEILCMTRSDFYKDKA
jgi:hypothetical protein